MNISKAVAVGLLILTALALSPPAKGAHPSPRASLAGDHNRLASRSASATQTNYEELQRRDEQTRKAIEDALQSFGSAGGVHDTNSVSRVDRAVALEAQMLRREYQRFLRAHPGHAPARIAFGNFLFSQGDEKEALKQWQKASRLDPRNVEAWSLLAHYYQHHGPIEKLFECLTRTMQIEPSEATHVWNLAAAVSLFRKDAREYYKLAEPAVFGKAMELYRQARRLDPENYELASDLALTFYLVKPFPIDDALRAWRDALAIAENDEQRQTVYLHLGRISLNAGNAEDARQHFEKVTDPEFEPVKGPLMRRLVESSAKSAAGDNGR